MSIYKRSDSGRWCVLIRRKGFPTVSSSFSRKEDADAFNERILSEMDRCRALGVPFDPKDHIVGYGSVKSSGKKTTCMTSLADVGSFRIQ